MQLLITLIMVIIISALMLIELLTCAILFKLNDSYLSDTVLTIISTILLLQFISVIVIIVTGIYQHIKERECIKLSQKKYVSFRK